MYRVPVGWYNGSVQIVKTMQIADKHDRMTAQHMAFGFVMLSLFSVSYKTRMMSFKVLAVSFVPLGCVYACIVFFSYFF